MKLSIVIPVLGQHDLAKLCLGKIMDKQVHETEVLIIDNGGDFSVEANDLPDKATKFTIMRPKEGNIGVYPTFKFGMENTTGDVVLFIHSDLIVDEYGFDVRLMDAFENDEKLGLVGFIGSNEIDNSGGRGLGTTSNFQGNSYVYKGKNWNGSPARVHGMRDQRLSKAAVVDGCAMALRRTAFESIGYRENFPPHHHYDRLLSCQVLESGYKVGVLGIACDHISGQSTNGSEEYETMARVWAESHGLQKGNQENWNSVIYLEAERQFLKEWRDEKHFIPRKS